MARYTEGACQDGAAILCDGEMITIDEILVRLNQRDELLKASIELDKEMQASWKSGALPAIAISGEAVRNFHAAIAKAEAK